MVPDFLQCEYGVLNGVLNPVLRALARVAYWLARVARIWSHRLRVRAAHLPGMDTQVEPLIMTGEQVAELLQVSPRTVEEWRQTHAGPPFRRAGRHVRYLRPEVLAWFQELARHG